LNQYNYSLTPLLFFHSSVCTKPGDILPGSVIFLTVLKVMYCPFYQYIFPYM